MANKRKLQFGEENAKILADLIVDPQTTEQLRVKIIKEILEQKEGQSFFKTVFEDALSFGECISCGHLNHWAIPEDDLNQMGHVTYLFDPLVPENTRVGDNEEEICAHFEEACKKKKISF